MIQLTFETHGMIAKFGDRPATQFTAHAVTVDVTIADLESAADVLTHYTKAHGDGKARAIAARLRAALAEMTVTTASHIVSGVEIERAVDPHAVVVRALTTAAEKVAGAMAREAIEKATRETR